MKNFKLNIIALAISLAAISASADTLYYHDGGYIEGLIVKKTNDTALVNVGFGIVTVTREEIVRIKRSTPMQAAQLRESWAYRKKSRS
jgi:hypothetical protein